MVGLDEHHHYTILAYITRVMDIRSLESLSLDLRLGQGRERERGRGLLRAQGRFIPIIRISGLLVVAEAMH